MHKIFLDTDVILDLILEREPFNINAKKIFEKIELKSIIGYTSPVILTNIYYISSNIKNKKIALKNIRKICKLLKITTVDQSNIDAILGNDPIKDFEDDLQLYSAIKINLEFLITRNTKDFIKTDKIKVMHPDEFIEILEMEKK